MKANIIIGTRGSKLALWQAEHIAGLLRRMNPGMAVTLKHIVTTGDKILDVPLAQIGGKGLFTKELEVAMLAGEIDLAVHSLKDMPTELPAGLTLAATTTRMDPHDAFISRKYGSLDELPPGASVGTSSLRRKAQLLRLRPDLNIGSLRGNLDTRLRKLDEGQFDAIVLAAAGLKRLGLEKRIRQWLEPDVMLPAAAQGALAIEICADRLDLLPVLAPLMHQPSYLQVCAERAVSQALGGSCAVPLAAYATSVGHAMQLQAAWGMPDGRMLRARAEEECATPQQAEQLGYAVAQQLIAQGATVEGLMQPDAG